MVATLVAGPAAALSCLPANPLVAWHVLADEGTPFTVIHGTLDFDPGALPRPVEDGSLRQQVTPVTTRLSGFALTADGFTRPYAGEVTLAVQCNGPWCGSAVPGEPVLAFVTTADRTIPVDPCNTALMRHPAPEALELMRSCAATASVGGTCDRPVLRP